MPLLGIIASILGLAKSSGLIKSPEDELKLQTALLAAAAQQDSAFAQFISATSPTDNPRWVNAVIALIRPMITLLVTGSIVVSFWMPNLATQIQATMTSYGKSGPFGMMLLSIPLWWFTGRSIEKIWRNGSGTPGA